MAFPGLKGGRIKITGEPTYDYHCIAWTLGKTDAWVNTTSTVGGMTSLYASAGYRPVSEQRAMIALFVKQGDPTHGAVRISGNAYESKLGAWYRIVHSLRGLEGDAYGSVEKFYGK